MSDALLFIFAGALAIIACAFALLGVGVLLAVALHVAERLWGLRSRFSRWLEIRDEVREAERILKKCGEYNMTVEDVLTLEAHDEPFVD